MIRQCQLRLGSEVRYEPQAVLVDLTKDPYRLVAGTWRERQAETLEMDVLLRGSSLSELEQQAAALRRMLAFAEAWSGAMQGRPLYVYHKLCDDLASTAEIGATWRRKRVHSGRLELPDMTLSAKGQYAVKASLSLQVEPYWRRAAPEPAVEGSSSVAPHTVYAGGLFASAAVTTRRRWWSETTGVTARYHWTVANANCGFLQTDGDWGAWWNNSTKMFVISDSDANDVSTSALGTLSGLVDVTFIWEAGVRMEIVLDGKSVATKALCVLVKPAQSYTLLSPTGTQGVAQVQVWPSALTSAQAVGLHAWGVPEGELTLVHPPADNTNTNAAYALANVPGHGPADLRLLLSGTSQDYEQVRLGLRPLRTPATTLWECEAGTLGGATASNSNAAASGGSQARFTPTNTAWATRVTVALAADAGNVEALLGEHRLLLAGYDSAAAVQMNMLRWRLVIAGVAGAWSEEFAFGTVAQRSLLDLGTLSIPPGTWPEEALLANTADTGTFVALELDAKNTAGSGGGTLDMDALYLFPAEQEGRALGTLDVSAVQMALDFASDPPATTLTKEEEQLRFAGWVTYEGDALQALPDVSSYGAGLLRVYGLRDDDESAAPNDEIDVSVFVRPTWL